MPGDPVIVFDGVCRLCSAWVGFVLRHEREPVMRFCAMQSPAGRKLLAQHGLDPDDPVSFLLVDGAGAWRDSDAILRVLDTFGWPWRALRALAVVPRAWRDAAYRWLARNRYRVFGRRDTCMVPTPELKARFLD